MSTGAVQGFRGCAPQQTSTFERIKYSKFKHKTQQTPASGDTNSRIGQQVAGIRGVLMAPLDQESPGSSPGGQLEGPIPPWRIGRSSSSARCRGFCYRFSSARRSLATDHLHRRFHHLQHGRLIDLVSTGERHRHVLALAGGGHSLKRELLPLGPCSLTARNATGGRSTSRPRKSPGEALSGILEELNPHRPLLYSGPPHRVAKCRAGEEVVRC
jgi:hypothetical protein